MGLFDIHSAVQFGLANPLKTFACIPTLIVSCFEKLLLLLFSFKRSALLSFPFNFKSKRHRPITNQVILRIYTDEHIISA